MNSYLAFSLASMLQLALLALATDLLGGHAGRVGLSAALFSTLAAYTYAFATLVCGLGAWAAVMAATAVPVLACALCGRALLRLDSDDFLLCTIAAQLAFVDASANFESLGGAIGFSAIPPLGIGERINDALWLLVPAVVFVCLGLSIHFSGKGGIILHWVRDDEASAKTFGVSPLAVRFRILLAHALIASLAGTGFALTQGYVSPQTFSLAYAMTILTAVYAGGTGGYPAYMVLGAGLIVVLDELVAQFIQMPDIVGPIQRIVVGLTLIAIFVCFRRGLGGPIIETGPSAGRIDS